jgi:hypothetical protein
LADAQDSGSCVLDGTWGFNSPLAHESTDPVADVAALTLELDAENEQLDR